MPYNDIEMVNNETLHNFEMWIDGQRAFIDYKILGDIISLIHTEVPKQLEGKGVASALLEKTLSWIEKNNLQIVPLCSYVQHYLERHPEWNKLLAD